MIDLIVDTYGDPDGKELYIVTTVDKDNFEDTDAVLWRANDELHLYLLVKEMHLGVDEEDESYEVESEDFSKENLAINFEFDWGITILYQKIANIT
jgi:hypothetical protein